jgi:hypothetical protein
VVREGCQAARMPAVRITAQQAGQCNITAYGSPHAVSATYVMRGSVPALTILAVFCCRTREFLEEVLVLMRREAMRECKNQRLRCLGSGSQSKMYCYFDPMLSSSSGSSEGQHGLQAPRSGKVFNSCYILEATNLTMRFDRTNVRRRISPAVRRCCDLSCSSCPHYRLEDVVAHVH